MAVQNPSSLALSYFQQAATCFQKTQYVEAIQHYLAGLKHDQSRYYIYADLAKAYEMIGNWEQALTYLDISLQLCPNSTTALRRKARISEEKTYYQSIISELDLTNKPTTDFVRTIQANNTTHSTQQVQHRFFQLTVEPEVQPLMLWNFCQLIDITYEEVGSYLNCFPSNQVPISIKNLHNATPENYLPQWAGGAYDGHIHLNYCSDEEPELGVLYTLFRHEWTHLLIDITTQGNCPLWLNEGLAQTIARPLFAFEKLTLQQAEQDNSLPTLKELEQPFSELTNSQRKLWYLQSASIVSNLVNIDGFHSIQRLLSLLKDGTPIQLALKKTYAMNDLPIR